MIFTSNVLLSKALSNTVCTNFWISTRGKFLFMTVLRWLRTWKELLMIGIDTPSSWYILLVTKYKESRSVECTVLSTVILCGSSLFSCFNIRKLFRKSVFCFIWLALPSTSTCIGSSLWICDGPLLKDTKGSKSAKSGGRVK